MDAYTVRLWKGATGIVSVEAEQCKQMECTTH